MTDSRNILTQVVFGENSLTKISSSDMREFVNYVYDEHMNKENIADNLTTKDPSITLSSNQGYLLNQKIQKNTEDLTGIVSDIVDHDDQFVDIENSIKDNHNQIQLQGTDLVNHQKEIATNAKNIQDNLNTIQAQGAKIQINNDDYIKLKEDITKPKGILERVGTNEKNIKSINLLLGKDSTDLNTLETRIKANSSDISNIKSIELPGITTRINTLFTQSEAELKRIDKKTDDFRAKIDQNTKSNNVTNLAIVAAQTAISNQNLNFSKINQNISTLENDIQTVLNWEQTITASENTIKLAVADITKNTNAFQQVNTDIKTLELSVKDVNTENQELEKKVKDASVASGMNQKAVLSLQNTVSASSKIFKELTNDHVRMGTDITKLLADRTKFDGTLVQINKNIHTNTKDINDNKISINSGFQAVQNIDTKVTAAEKRITKTELDVQVQQQTSNQHALEINKNSDFVSDVENGRFVYPKMNILSENDQITIKAKPGTHEATCIQGKDSAGNDLWYTGTTTANQKEFVISSEKIKLQGSTQGSITYETQDPNDATKKKLYDFIGLPTNVNPANGDFIFWDAPVGIPGQNVVGAWSLKSSSDMLNFLGVDSAAEVDTKIQTSWDNGINDIKTNYLPSQYFTKNETYDRQAIDDALKYQVENTPLDQYGTLIDPADQGYKDWEKLRNYSPQTRPTDLAVSASIATIAEAEAEIMELQTKLNELLSQLEVSGILV